MAAEAGLSSWSWSWWSGSFWLPVRYPRGISNYVVVVMVLCWTLGAARVSDAGIVVCNPTNRHAYELVTEDLGADFSDSMIIASTKSYNGCDGYMTTLTTPGVLDLLFRFSSLVVRCALMRDDVIEFFGLTYYSLVSNSIR